MRCILLILSSLVISSSYGNVKALSRELLSISQDVRVSKDNIKLAKLQFKDIELQLAPKLGASYQYSKDELESFSGFGASISGGVTKFPLVSKVSSLSLSKDFSWGGSLSFENSLRQSELLGVTPVYGFFQTLSYDQDLLRNFFGRQFRNQVSSGEHNLMATKYRSQFEMDNALFLFTSDYLSAALAKKQISFQVESIKRTKRRVALTKKRVRDGLNERVDLVQARVSLLNQEELLVVRKREFENAIDSISRKLHRRIVASEIINLTEKNLKTTEIPNIDLSKTNQINELKEKVEQVKLDHEMSDNDLYPELTLKASVQNNDYDAVRSNSLSNGTLGNENKEVSIALNLSWTLGSVAEKNKRAQLEIQKNLKIYQLDKTTTNLEKEIKSLVKQIKLLEDSYNFSKRRVKLNKSALEEYEKLYRKGRADFDQVIQAEENLITTLSDVMSSYVNREKAIYRMAFLGGNLNTFMKL
jgi:outer membrane protein TolC